MKNKIILAIGYVVVLILVIAIVLLAINAFFYTPKEESAVAEMIAATTQEKVEILCNENHSSLDPNDELLKAVFVSINTGDNHVAFTCWYISVASSGNSGSIPTEVDFPYEYVYLPEGSLIEWKEGN